MERIDDFLKRRAEIWAGILGYPCYRRVRLNRVKNWANSAFWMVCLEVEIRRERSDAFMGGLKTRGIDFRSYFCTMSSMPMYQHAVPGLGRKAQIGLNLPSYYESTRPEVQRIGVEVNDILNEGWAAAG